MQVKTYTDLKALIQALAGVSSFTSEEDSKILSFVNRRAAEAYNLSPSWARYLVESEKRNLAVMNVSGFVDSNPYSTRYNGLYYKYGDDANGNPVYITVNGNNIDQSTSVFFQKSNSTKNWNLVGGSFTKNIETGVVTTIGSAGLAIQRDSDIEYDNPWDVVWAINSNQIIEIEKVQTVSYDEVKDIYSSSDTRSQKTTIGEPIRIHRKQAFLNNSALEYDFFTNSDGVNILNVANSEDGVVYVTYKKPFTEFTTSSTDIPQEFFYFIAHAAYADFLRMDGQHGKALTEEQLAQSFLDIELEKIDIRSNNNSINRKFSTYVNRQSR